jgi:hypothetical protein
MPCASPCTIEVGIRQFDTLRSICSGQELLQCSGLDLHTLRGPDTHLRSLKNHLRSLSTIFRATDHESAMSDGGASLDHTLRPMDRTAPTRHPSTLDTKPSKHVSWSERITFPDESQACLDESGGPGLLTLLGELQRNLGLQRASLAATQSLGRDVALQLAQNLGRAGAEDEVSGEEEAEEAEDVDDVEEAEEVEAEEAGAEAEAEAAAAAGAADPDPDPDPDQDPDPDRARATEAEVARLKARVEAGAARLVAEAASQSAINPARPPPPTSSPPHPLGPRPPAAPDRRAVQVQTGLLAPCLRFS